MKDEKLYEVLHQVLEEKRYLVVLDDIWNVEAWDCLKHAFPNGKRGSKVLLTTRNRDLASHADPGSTLVEPPLLTSEEGWELLCRKAFLEDLPEVEKFEKLGKEMVKRCGGLPLAVVVLGGLLATKKSLKEWEIVQRNIDAQFTKMNINKYGGVYGMLGMSYEELPFQLKPCFLHLAQFPEDWAFQKRSLIRLWIAEGFVQPVQGGEETLEDVGEQYLQELVSRCMVQVSERDHTGFGVKSFRIHDLMRDMCISKARDDFGAFMEYEYSLATKNSSRCFVNPATRMVRRIAIYPYTSTDDVTEVLYAPLVKRGDVPNLRSLVYLVERGEYHMNRDQEIYICENFRLLRVLNLRGIKLHNHQMHRAVGKLIHLRYLGLRGTGLEEKRRSPCSAYCLPASIGNLKNLYTLDLRDNGYGLRLPNHVLLKLENLRHLLVDLGSSIGGSIGLFDSLGKLETLKMVEAKSLITRKGKEVLGLPNLRNLGILFSKKEEAENVIRSHSIFGGLRSLKMWMREVGGYFPNLESLSNCHNLTKLELEGGIPEDDHNLQFLPKSLAKLILRLSCLKQDPMGILEKELPNLRFLSLENRAYGGSKMVCSTNGFPKLEMLTLVGLNEVEEWEIEKGAMPCLNTLHVSSLGIKMIPQGLKFVTTIQQLKLSYLSAELKRRVQVENGIEGEDFHKIHHIPFVTIH